MPDERQMVSCRVAWARNAPSLSADEVGCLRRLFVAAATQLASEDTAQDADQEGRPLSCSLPSVHRGVPRWWDRARCRLRSTGLVAAMTLEPRDFRGSFDQLDQERRAEGCCDPGEEQP